MVQYVGGSHCNVGTTGGDTTGRRDRTASCPTVSPSRRPVPSQNPPLWVNALPFRGDRSFRSNRFCPPPTAHEALGSRQALTPTLVKPPVTALTTPFATPSSVSRPLTRIAASGFSTAKDLFRTRVVTCILHAHRKVRPCHNVGGIVWADCHEGSATLSILERRFTCLCQGNAHNILHGLLRLVKLL